MIQISKYNLKIELNSRLLKVKVEILFVGNNS